MKSSPRPADIICLWPARYISALAWLFTSPHQTLTADSSHNTPRPFEQKAKSIFPCTAIQRTSPYSVSSSLSSQNKKCVFSEPSVLIYLIIRKRDLWGQIFLGKESFSINCSQVINQKFSGNQPNNFGYSRVSGEVHPHRWHVPISKESS